MSKKLLPVTIISGFLGSGKTTLLNHILKNQVGLKTAVLVNEFGEIGIDNDLIIEGSEDMIELNNGCICSSINGELLNTVSKVVERSEKIDYLIVETTGLADPLPVAMTFAAGDLREKVRLDSIITVIDGENFDFEIDNTTVAYSQILYGDILLLNKCDLVNEAKLKKLIYDVDESLFNKDNYSNEKFEHLCVRSGGTTSSCAKNGFTPLDLRKNYSKIHLERKTNLVTIGGGVIMGDLVNHLQKHNRSFPIGLSKLPGAGYILTGGVSPLSRAYGLAIDNIESIKGFLGNGTFISLKKNQINPEEQLIWEAIKGAAPFFSIITEIELKTIQSNPIKVIEGFVNQNELSEIIQLSEEFPENISLQWIYAQKIYIYVVVELKNNLEDKRTEECLMPLNKFPALEEKLYKNFNKINFFPKELNLYELNANNHSDVISLLGEDLKNDIPIFIKCLNEIIDNKPNKYCYVASQQLGCKTKKLNHGSSFFVHRKSTWKPWIYASWKKNDLQEKEVALEWIYKSWGKLKRFYPNIHLAQLHNHLNSHEEEITLAFGNRVNELKTLKNIFDPQGILPPL